MATHVALQKEGYLARIVFSEDNERHPCTLDWEVLAEFENCIREIARNSQDYSVVIIESSSAKSFVVGANIAVLKTQNAENIMDWVHNGHRIFNLLQQLPVPVIAKVARHALGGGLELAMACDFIIAGENATFAHPEAGLGVMPGWGGSFRLQMYVGPNRAKEMIFTGKVINAQLAYEWGLVNHVCREEELDDYVVGIAEQMAKNEKKVLAYSKEIINEETQLSITRNAFQEAIASSVCMNSESTKKRLENFFERRKK